MMNNYFRIFLLYGMKGEDYFRILDYLYENVQWISIRKDVFIYYENFL